MKVALERGLYVKKRTTIMGVLMMFMPLVEFAHHDSTT